MQLSNKAVVSFFSISLFNLIKNIGLVEINDPRCGHRCNYILILRTLSAFHHFSFMRYLSNSLKLTMVFSVQIGIVNGIFLPKWLFGQTDSLYSNEIRRIFNRFIIEMSACQEVSELKICKNWVTKSKKIRKSWLKKLLFEVGKPLNWVTRSLKSVLDENVINEFGIVHQVLFPHLIILTIVNFHFTFN